MDSQRVSGSGKLNRQATTPDKGHFEAGQGRDRLLRNLRNVDDIVDLDGLANDGFHGQIL
jgi:hypothetical protein